MILFGFHTGQRFGDIIRLTHGNIDLVNAVLTLDSRKTERRQILPIAPALLDWLRGH